MWDSEIYDFDYRTDMLVPVVGLEVATVVLLEDMEEDTVVATAQEDTAVDMEVEEASEVALVVEVASEVALPVVLLVGAVTVVEDTKVVVEDSQLPISHPPIQVNKFLSRTCLGQPPTKTWWSYSRLQERLTRRRFCLSMVDPKVLVSCNLLQ